MSDGTFSTSNLDAAAAKVSDSDGADVELVGFRGSKASSVTSLASMLTKAWTQPGYIRERWVASDRNTAQSIAFTDRLQYIPNPLRICRQNTHCLRD